MTRKHFKALAEALKESKGDMLPEDFTKLVANVGRACVGFNPRFDYSRFAEAAGVEYQ